MATKKGAPAPPVQGRPASPAQGRPASPAQGRPTSPSQGRPASPAKGRPASPAKGRPASPAKGRPASPAKGRPASPAQGTPSKINANHNEASEKLSSSVSRAMELEAAREFSDAAILFRSAGLVEDENRCLQLALNKSQELKTTIIHNGDRIIQDSVIMNQDD
jgi:hypothetical protein